MSRKRKKRAVGRRAGPSLAGRLFRVLFVLVLLGAAGAGAALFWLWPRCSGAACPSVASLRSYVPPQASRVFDREGEVLAHLAPERRIVVPLERIPAHVTGAFLAVEDQRFYEHDGVDYRRVAGAMLRNARTMHYDEGFSTLTMQLARNVFPEQLTRAKTIRRKLWEVTLARRIEQTFPKDQILEMYLNQIYLGDGLYGVEAAARGYFGKPATRLSLDEAALLAGLPKAPSYYTPRRNRVAAIQRRNLVLRLMAEQGRVAPERVAEAQAEPLALAPPREAQGRAPFFVAAVRRELRERFGPDADTEGLRVYTTLDPALQARAERELREQLAAIEAGRFGRFAHTSCARRPVKAPEGCLQGMVVAMDPRTGDVWALVGGRDFELSQFDRATQSRRQAGSAFKPFVYAAALQAGIPVSTPLVGPGAEESTGDYRPADHVADTLTLDMRGALRVSSNRAAVALGERVGAAQVVQTAQKMGFSTPIQPYPSTFLGAADVIPIELVAAYSPFATGGSWSQPRMIRRVENSAGRVIWEQAPVRRVVLSPGVAYLTTSLMRDVVDRGTGNGVRAAGLPYTVPAAGKTGTTNDAADVWFVGVTPDLVAGVWIGFDRPKRILRGASGGGLAAPVWGRIATAFYRTRSAPAAWAPPAELVYREIDRETGELATTNCPPEHRAGEYFLPGTEPPE
ncbi:MAG: PBP1A family penicillin-binding protein, partial [Gemmatimonadota bacterium]|nr:PBP1A family penicillin-binding protein [Gemmatimonadota bacterium]